MVVINNGIYKINSKWHYQKKIKKSKKFKKQKIKNSKKLKKQKIKRSKKFLKNIKKIDLLKEKREEN